MPVHSWEWVTDTEPTCGKAGTKHVKCSVCGAVQNENTEIEAFEHQYEKTYTQEATCTKDGYVVSMCKLCGDKQVDILKKLGHDWGEWTVTKEATEYAEGEETRVCKRDPSHTETRAIPKKEKELPPVKPVIPYIPYYPIISKPVVPVTPITTEEPETPALPFTDVSESDPFYNDVKYVYENGIMNGVSETRFDPASPLTRGMIVTILYRTEGEPDVPYTGTFTDVPAGEWYTDGVEWAASKGIVKGYGDDTYGAKDLITREQLAAILYRYAEYKGYAIRTGSLSAADVGDVSGWAAKNVEWAAANGILKANGEGKIRPTEPASRAEIAAAIRAFLEGVAK